MVVIIEGLGGTNLSKLGHVIRCPRDESVLNADEYAKDTILICNSCHGLVIAVHNVLKVENLKKKIAPSIQPSKLSCPECKKYMNAFMRDEVEIDICFSCNLLWLDNGEIEKIKSSLKHKDKSDSLNIGDAVIDIVKEEAIFQVWEIIMEFIFS